MASTDPNPASPPGLLDRILATIAAVRRVALAHVALARTELGAIASDIAGMLAKAAAAAALLFFVGVLVSVGATLFLGDWLFGSMGWGVLHGTLFLSAIAVSLILSALGLGRGTGLRILIGIALAVAIGIALGGGWARDAWTVAGERSFSGVVPEWRTLAAAFVGGAVAIGLLAALLGLVKGGLGGLITGLVMGGVLGALLGVLTAATVDARAGAAIGVALGLATWLGLSLARFGALDPGTLKARFIPSATIETAQETLAWLRTIRP